MAAGLPCKAGHQFAVGIRNRRRHQHAALGQVAHQLQIERQLLEAQVFKDRQHIFAALGAEEKIAVFNAGSDALERQRLAEGKLLDPLAEIVQV